MTLPYFYSESIVTGATTHVLEEEASRHVVQVLRMQNGEQLQLTDGRGNLFTAAITDNNKRHCLVNILTSTFQPPAQKKVVIGISLVKNAHRFEWFLEKATEIGVTEIVPLLCSRTEKQHFRMDRMKGILISALLQSQQSWLPLLHEPQRINNYLNALPAGTATKKMVAHCKAEEPRMELLSCQPFNDTILLIGPEGDFTIDEVELALQHDFKAVSLGSTRLRTETAGIVAATMLCMHA